jgi:hypothetical protein
LDDEEALKCRNLELEIEAELDNDNEAYALELTMDEIIGELVKEEVEETEVEKSGNESDEDACGN